MLEDPGGVEPLGARIKSPLPNRLRLERSGSIGDGDTAASRPGFLIVMVMLVSCCWFSSNLGMSVCRTDALAAWRSELRAQGWCGGCAQTKVVHPGGFEPPCLAAAASEAAA